MLFVYRMSSIPQWMLICWKIVPYSQACFGLCWKLKAHSSFSETLFLWNFSRLLRKYFCFSHTHNRGRKKRFQCFATEPEIYRREFPLIATQRTFSLILRGISQISENCQGGKFLFPSLPWKQIKQLVPVLRVVISFLFPSKQYQSKTRWIVLFQSFWFMIWL